MHPRFLDSSPMSEVAYMVDRLARSEDGTVADVRRLLARRIGIAPGTIENIQRGRLKFIERVEWKVRAAFIRLLEREIAKATHELEIARIASDRVDTAAVVAAEASLVKRIEEAREVISRG